MNARRSGTGMNAPSPPLLRVESLSVAYGAIVALRAVDFEVQAGEIVTHTLTWERY